MMRPVSLHSNRFRYYDPTIGRYISADPIGQMGGANIYTYVSGDPLNWVDPLGLILEIGGSSAYYSAAQTAIAYVTQAPNSATQAIIDSDTTFHLEPTSASPNGKPGYDSVSNTIYWDPNTGVEAPIYTGTSCETGIDSPAIVLEHEAGHAKKDDDFGFAIGLALRLGLISQSNLETDIVENVEAPAATYLGEPVRLGHVGDLVDVQGPTPATGGHTRR